MFTFTSAVNSVISTAHISVIKYEAITEVYGSSRNSTWINIFPEISCTILHAHTHSHTCIKLMYFLWKNIFSNVTAPVRQFMYYIFLVGKLDKKALIQIGTREMSVCMGKEIDNAWSFSQELWKVMLVSVIFLVYLVLTCIKLVIFLNKRDLI